MPESSVTTVESVSAACGAAHISLTLGVALPALLEVGMPDTRRINMRKIRDVLRLKLEVQLSHEQTAAALNISKCIITKYRTLASSAGLDWRQIYALDDTRLL